MNEYRAYLVGLDGHIVGREDLVCDTEEMARERAKQLVDGHDIELWQGGRMITRFFASSELARYDDP